MAAKSSIEWTDATWNPIRGCTRISPGCQHCYAERMAARGLPGMNSPTTGEPFATMTPGGPRWTGNVELIESKLDEPLHWKAPRRIFVNSVSDTFHKDVRIEALLHIWTIMWQTPRHTYMVLTKRADRLPRTIANIHDALGMRAPLPNVWLGVSVEDQERADQRIPHLLQAPAAVRFVSMEPMLGPVNLHRIEYEPEGSGGTCFLDVMRGQGCSVGGSWKTGKLDWVIVGGESGPGARPMNPDWARSIRDQCKAAGVAFFMKQMDKKQPIPADLLIREWPRTNPVHAESEAVNHEE